MAKLVINPTSSARREVPLGRSLLTIGRDPSNDLVLPDALVSRRHAVIECRGDQYVLRDCNSSNGSLVNGDRISEHPLKDGDLLAVGTSRMLFRGTVDVEEPVAKVVVHPSSPRLSCPACHTDFRRGDLFCRQCGQALPPPAPVHATCAKCGVDVPLPAKFCTACGTSLPSVAAIEVTRPRPMSVAEDPAGRPPAPPDNAAPPPSPAVEPPKPAPMAEAPSPAPPPHAELNLRPGSGASLVALQKAEPRPATAPRAPTPVMSPRPVGIARSEARPAPPVVPASFGARLGAAMIDAILVGVAQLVLVAPAAYYFYRWFGASTEVPAEPTFLPILLSVALVVVAMILGAGYYVYFWGVKGATPGKRAMGLVVQGSDGVMPIGVGHALLRLLGCMLSAAFLGIGFLMIAWSGYGLHDRLASTRVVRAREGA